MQIRLNRGACDGNGETIEKGKNRKQAKQAKDLLSLLQAPGLAGCGRSSAWRALSKASSGLESTGACTTSAASVVKTRAIEACASTIKSTPFKSSTSARANNRSWVAVSPASTAGNAS